MKSKAMAQVADRRFEMVEVEIPKIGRDQGLLRVSMCGICGTDVEQYNGGMKDSGIVSYPLIPGHEPIGVIEDIGADAATRWRVKVGDRVAIEPLFACGRCDTCRQTNRHLCKRGLEGRWGCYGFMPLNFGSGLWGGFSEYIHLHADTALHVIPSQVPFNVAALYQSLASGIRWAVRMPNTQLGDTVLILGCGQRGLAAIAACRAAGAGCIIATGLKRDAHKLKVAKLLGAHHTIVSDEENTVERVMQITGGRGVDTAVDVVPFSVQPVLDAFDAVRIGGSVILAGQKSHKLVEIAVDKLIEKEIKVQAVFGQTSRDYATSMELLAQNVELLRCMQTHVFPLEEVDKAIRTLAGEYPSESPISVAVSP